MLREFEATRAPLDGARKCAFLMPEQLAFHQRFRHGRAVDSHKWTGTPRAQVMNGAGNQFFPCAAFAVDQHRRLARGHLPNQRKNLLHRRPMRQPDRPARPYTAVRAADARFLRPTGFAQTRARAGCAARPVESVFPETRTRPDRESSRWRFRYCRTPSRTMAGGMLPDVPSRFSKLKSIHTRHHQIRNKDLHRAVVQFVERILSIASGFRGKSPR